MKMKLTMIVFLYETFHMSVGGCGQNTSEKKTQNKFFGLISWNFQHYIKTITNVTCYLTLQHWSKFCTSRTWFGVVIFEKPPKSSQQSYFLLLRQTLKIHNLRTTNAILMKLTKIMYLHETFHLAKNFDITPRVQVGVVQEALTKSQKKSVFGPNFDHFFTLEQKLSHISCITLHCISGKNFKYIWSNFMGLHPINQKTDI